MSYNDQTLTYNGLARTFHIYTPTPAPTGPAPLILMLHGHGGSGVGTGAGTGFDYIAQMNPVADANGIYLIYADGLVGADGKTGWDDDGSQGFGDDGFLMAAIAQTQGIVSVDPTKISVAGYSNGAGMTAALALKHGASFASAAMIAGDYTPSSLAFCGGAPTAVIPVIEFHGTADKIWNYNGFTGSNGRVYLPTEQTWQQWAAWDNCTVGPTAGTLYTDSASGTTAQAFTYATNTVGGPQAILYKVVGGGHQVPGGNKVPGCGPLTNAINAAQLIATFALSYTRVSSSAVVPIPFTIHSPSRSAAVSSPARTFSVSHPG